MQPLITIVVPVYNTEQYLFDCLNSIKYQTFSEIQVLIINDCTPDNSIQIAEKFSKMDSRFEIIHHEENKGLGGARNTGIDYAKGKYIAFLDSDDFYPLDALSKMYCSIEASKADMVIGRMYQKTSNGKLLPIDYIESKVQKFLKYPYTNLRDISSKDFYSGNVANRLFRLSLFKENSIRYMNEVYYEDMPISLETWFYSRNISVIPHIIHFRTVREDIDNPSITQTFNRKSFYDRDIVLNDIYDFCLRKAAFNNDLVDLTLEILGRLNSTTKNMLSSASADVSKEILESWYPEYMIRYDKMIKDISMLNEELSVNLY